MAVQEEDIVVVGSLYVYSWKYCGISRAMVLLCAISGVSPAPLSHFHRTPDIIFPLQTNHVGMLNEISFPLDTSCELFNFASISSFWVLPAQPYRAPSLSVVGDMAEQGCPGMGAAPQREDALLCRHKSSPNAPTTPCPQLP